MKKNQKIVAAVAAASLMLSVGATSFAYFTDTASIVGSTTAGKVAVGISATDDISTQLLNTAFENAVQNLNPGDSRTIEYTVSNVENKAIRTNDTVTLTVTVDEDYAGSAFAEAAYTDSMITLNGLTLDTDASSYADGVFTLVYTGVETVLSGTGTNAEVIDGEDTSLDREYTVLFSTDAGNEWQNAAVEIGVQIDAVQYANTTALADATAVAETVVTDASGADVRA